MNKGQEHYHAAVRLVRRSPDLAQVEATLALVAYFGMLVEHIVNQPVDVSSKWTPHDCEYTSPPGESLDRG